MPPAKVIDYSSCGGPIKSGLEGKRVCLKIDRTGIIWNDNGTGTGKKLQYTVHVANKGDEGTVVDGIYAVNMDSGIEICCVGSDFENPDEEFERTFEVSAR